MNAKFSEIYWHNPSSLDKSDELLGTPLKAIVQEKGWGVRIVGKRWRSYVRGEGSEFRLHRI